MVSDAGCLTIDTFESLTLKHSESMAASIVTSPGTKLAPIFNAKLGHCKKFVDLIANAVSCFPVIIEMTR